MSKIQVIQVGRLWIALLPTAYGQMELLCGEGDTPDMRMLALIERFIEDRSDHIAAIRRSAYRIPRLWRPIRFAINNEGRLGLQFKHRITGRQDGMYFADECSSFTAILSDVSISEAEVDRLKERLGY